MARYVPQQIFKVVDTYRELLRVSEVVNDIDDNLRTETATTTELADASSAINNQEKYTGKIVFNTTTTAPVWAAGGDATDVWVDSTGSTAHTPT